MPELRVTELDFAGIKTNLKEFLASQPEFSDYNFEGSAMSVLLDVLAYNTHYNATLAHMLANEMFLDSALKRSSVVSIAKTMGYVPNSQHSARATINLTITAPSGYTGSTLLLSKNTVFTGTGLSSSFSGSGQYSFSPDKDYTVGIANQTGSIKTFVFENIPIIQGNRVTNSFIVDTTNLSGPFVIPNKDVDTTTLKVTVQNSSTDLTLTSFNYAGTSLNIDGSSNSFWVEEGTDGLFRIIFGDNIIGKQLEYGNIVTVEYFVGAAEYGNNIRNFKMIGNLINNNETKLIEVVNVAGGGTPVESIDSIKYYAPKFNTTRDRAVTAEDYKSLIQRDFPGINSITVWGGEENDPPIYGKVFICLDPVENTIITETDKDNIARSIIGPKSVVSIQPQFVDPEYTYIGINSSIKYLETRTTQTSSQVEELVRQTIQGYFSTNLNKLAKNFYYSQLSSDIMDSLDAITTNTIDLTLHKRFTNIISSQTGYRLTPNFGQQIAPASLHSTNFKTYLDGLYYDVYMVDVPDSVPADPTGTGTIHLKQVGTGSTISTNVGTIDYNTGKIVIPNTYFIEYLGGATSFRIYVKPQNVTADITTKILSTDGAMMESTTGPIIPTVSRNSLLKLDTSGANVDANIPVGLTVSAYPQ